jgi:hypothetical protein
MTDVTDGGGTVFPFLGVRVQPVAGDLLLWRNNDAEGLCDTLSAHAYVGPTHVCNVACRHTSWRELPPPASRYY